MFDSGLPKDVAVTWDEIPAGACGKYGTFEISGTAAGYQLKPTATIRVRDTQTGQNISLATPVGMEPKLPESTAVYYTDGASVLSSVAWQEYNPEDLKKEGIFTIKGITELGGYEVTASVRVTSDTVQSENHAKNRNGCPYSKAIASYSEGNSAVALNDGLQNKWTDWGNPNKKGEVWFGVIFGADYPELRYVDTVVLDLLEDSEWNRTKIETCKVEYYNQPITLEDVPKSVANFDDASMANHPFNNPDNWSEVTNLKEPDQYKYGENVLTFDMIEVPAIRVTVNHGTPGGQYYMALREFYAYGKLAAANSDFTVSELTADGKPLEGFEAGKYNYTYQTTGGNMPKFVMSADSNASVTLIPAINTYGEAKFIVVSEDGLKTESYTVRLLDPEAEMEELKKELEDTKKELERKETELLGALEEIEKARKEKDAAQKELADAREKLKEANQKLEEAIQEAEDAKEDAAQKIAIAQKEVSEAQETVAQALALALEAEEKLAEALRAKAAVERELAEAQNKIAELQKQAASLQEELAEALKKQNEAEEAQKKAEQEAKAAKEKAEQEAKAAKEAQEARLKAEQEAREAQEALKRTQQALEEAQKKLSASSAKKTVIRFDKKKYTVKKGKSVRLGVTIKNQNGAKVTYKSANKKIARVSKKGVVKGLKKGKTKITVTCNKKKKSVTVQVK